MAALDRARRSAIEPLNVLYPAHAIVCACYLGGFLRFQFFETNGDFSILSALLLLIVASCGVLVPILSGSVFTLLYANQRLNKLVEEQRSHQIHQGYA
ncbi:MAG: hypothetical protein ABJM90_04860 [Paracoccaceae bacterium]